MDSQTQDAPPRDDAPPTSSKDIHPQRALSAEAVTIRRPASELYVLWRSLDRLPEFMENVERIEVVDDRRSRWTVKAPGGGEVSWDAIITDDRPGESLSWRSAEGADIQNSGKVEFIDRGERGTVVRATIAYDPPAGILGKLAAKLTQREPRIQSRRDLRRFKQMMEAGEIATSARSLSELETRRREGDEE